MFSKKNVLTGLLFIVAILAKGQSCHLLVSGQIIDAADNTPIAYASITAITNQNGTLSDAQGFFQLPAICPDNQQFIVQYLGYETQYFSFFLTQDTVLSIALQQNVQTIETVVITEKAKNNSTQQQSILDEKMILDNANQNLANLLENLSGVRTLKNGNGLGKPVVHGLYGNRLMILNNGIAQSGQQWGNDHSPEIDPLVANTISVIKGVGTLEHQGSSLGSIILVTPNKIGEDTHLHGKINYFFETNGRGHTVNTQFQDYNSRFAWRITGTLKKSGDNHTPDYFLRNTGHETANLAVQLEKKWSNKWQSDVYFSSFNTKVGVLRGSHIGNLTDLESAFSQSVPFFTMPNFSYTIDAPNQKVHHHLLKIHTQYFINVHQLFDITYAAQVNIRKEFDVRRSGWSDIPALNLQQVSNFLEGKYQRFFNNDWHLKTGIQTNIIKNRNDAETGILPLIPNYFLTETGIFLTIHKRLEKALFELGTRYDNVQQDVAAISQTLPRTIIYHTNNFNNFNIGGGANYRFRHLKVSYNIGFATRNPAINELYSNGLHQGVSGIEEGNANLKTEKSFKTTIGLERDYSKKLSFEVLFYYQNINNYIFLKPQEGFRLTIRGAFPVFHYEQTTAQIYGSDFTVKYSILKNCYVTTKYSYLKGQDLTNNLPLVNMPTNNLSINVDYQIENIGTFKNLELSGGYQHVSQQKHLLEFQDFVVPPVAYNLVNIRLSIQKTFKHSTLQTYLKVNNLFNVRYRDYLNRQRYFADELGVNIVMGCSWLF